MMDEVTLTAGEVSCPVTPGSAAAVVPLRLSSDAESLNESDAYMYARSGVTPPAYAYARAGYAQVHG
jgi:hypothetical protein